MFKKAKAIFIKDGDKKLNCFASFKTNLKKCNDAEIKIAAHYFYKLFVNKKSIAFGPARTAYGYARVDKIDISTYLVKDCNEVEIVVAGYNCRSLSTCKYHPFLTAEIYCDKEVVAYTGKDFTAYENTTYISEAYRYSLQRHFTELVNFNNNLVEAEAVLVDEPKYIDRHVNYPTYESVAANLIEAKGVTVINENKEYAKATSTNFNIANNADWGYYDNKDISFFPYENFQQRDFYFDRGTAKFPVKLNKNDFAIIDFKDIQTGFINLNVAGEYNAQILVAFSEYSEDRKFTFVADTYSMTNCFSYALKDGENVVETFEPYTMKKVCVMVKEGSVTLNSAKIITYEGYFNKITAVRFKDDDLNVVYNAAVRSFTQNAVDLFTDCPSRERAGWLCDSYFSANAEYFLTGKTTVEDNFLENYVLFENFGDYHDGMIPMCYPSDYKNESHYIPQWSMWFILQAYEYLTERNKTVSVEKFRKTIDGLLRYYKRYENSDGLLESLPGWNFIEWSKANSLTKGVNYPTNFLYSEVLIRVSKLYNDESMAKKAEEIRKTAIKQSFDGKFFHDLAVRNENGELQVTDDVTEICQYYAINFGGVNVFNENYKTLLNAVINVFKYDRTEYPEIEKIDMFIGAYLKLMALDKIRAYKNVIETVKDYFLPMAKKTGTLWEHIDLNASLNHGFASYAAVLTTKAAQALDLLKR